MGTPASGANNKAKPRLSQLTPGDVCSVVGVHGHGRISKRLGEMGVVPGVLITVVKTAPFGDPFEIRLLGYNLAIRKREAELIEVVEKNRDDR